MESPQISPKFIAALLLAGVLAGAVGIAFTHLLHLIQQLVFSGSLADGHISFRELVRQASPQRRVAALLACGAVVGVLWTLLQRYGAPLLDVKDAVRQPEKIGANHRLALNSTPIPQGLKLPGRYAEVKPEFTFFQKQWERFAVDSVVFA